MLAAQRAEPATTLYALLGVDITASTAEIRTAFLKLAKVHHPDRRCGDSQATCHFQQLQNAYEVLKDPQRRQEYDLNLLDCLQVEDYLERYQDFVLTVNGLGIRLVKQCTQLKCQRRRTDIRLLYYHEPVRVLSV